MKNVLAVWIAAAFVVMNPPALTAGSGLPTTSPTAAPAEAPTGLTVSVIGPRVTLLWSAVPGASGYRVFRTLTEEFGTVPLASVSATMLKGQVAQFGTPHRFRVCPYNAVGSGPCSAEVSVVPVTVPAQVQAIPGDRRVTVSWQPVPGATQYVVARQGSSRGRTLLVPTVVTAPPFVEQGLVNGITYHYRVRALAPPAAGDWSATVWAKPQPPPPQDAPANLTAAAAQTKVLLSWDAVAGATRYHVYRTATAEFTSTPHATVSTTGFKDWAVVNGTRYAYRVAGANPGGIGPPSATVSATPMALPAAPTGLAAVAGDVRVDLSWAAVDGAATYSVYRGLAPNRQDAVALVAGLVSTSFADTSVTNGPTYYYKVTASNVGGESRRSAEVSASPEGPPPGTDATTLAAFRFLRYATWGPSPADLERLRAADVEAFLSDQLAAAPSVYPDALLTMSMEAMQEHFLRLALTGPDQLRQRVAWALHKIWVVSASSVNKASAMVPYQRILMGRAFGNYRDLMEDMTLNPAMGRYLNMLNSRSQQVTGTPPNENYARELLQLFTTGIPLLRPDGTPIVDLEGREVPAYTEDDVKELSRVFTGWTFGDGNAGTAPARRCPDNYGVPMEPVERYHDTGSKMVWGEAFPAGQSARQDLAQALDLIFTHPNVGPFVSRQLIQQLVTSNPSPAYVAAAAAAFDNNGAGVRGDLGAVVRAILTHPEASTTTDAGGKLAEPVLFVIAPLRALGAAVTDHPFLADRVEDMGQRVFYPPSVFSYFSPGFRVRGTTGANGRPLAGPEFQILTSVTALARVNFVAALVADCFGRSVTIDYTAFTDAAANPPALVDLCARVFMGTRISNEHRAEIIAAVRASPPTNALDRVRTAIYLTLAAAQSQVDR